MIKKYKEYQKYYDEDDEEEIKKILFGRKVKVVSNTGDIATLELDNGTKLKVKANRGCICGAGDYWIYELNNVDNAITDIRFEKHCVDKDDCDYAYEIFVFCEDRRIKLLDVEGSDGNGYYGTGYTFHVIEEIDNEEDKQ